MAFILLLLATLATSVFTLFVGYQRFHPSQEDVDEIFDRYKSTCQVLNRTEENVLVYTHGWCGPWYQTIPSSFMTNLTVPCYCLNFNAPCGSYLIYVYIEDYENVVKDAMTIGGPITIFLGLFIMVASLIGLAYLTVVLFKARTARVEDESHSLIIQASSTMLPT